MFRGRNLLKMDAKGRLSVPARHREIINVLHDGRLVLSQGFFPDHPHLLIVPLDVWEGFEATFGGEELFDVSIERFQARLRTMGGCDEVRIDEHGRIRIPAAHREYAGYAGEVVCVGMGRYLSLWLPDRLDRVMARAEENLDALRGQLAARTPTGHGDPSTDR
jgi:MraZ protein